MKKNMKRILVICLAVVILLTSVTTVIAATIYYYFGYYYTYINSDMVSLYGINKDEFDMVFVPDTLNNKKLVDISNNAFSNDTDIRKIDFGGASNLERIGSFAFNGCTNAAGEVKIPANVTVIEVAAFQNCTALESVVYNAACGYVPNQCFRGCSSLTNVSLNDSISSIGDYAFADCASLSYIEIPASVTSIADTAFQNDNITLGVYTDSYAHQYAEQMGINYILLDAPEPPTEPETEEPTVPETQEPTVIETEAPTVPETQEPTVSETVKPTQPVTEPKGYYLGDVDCNNVVESIDAALIQRLLANLGYSASCIFEHGDVDGDGRTTIIDATLIQRYLGNLYVPYEINKFITE